MIRFEVEADPAEFDFERTVTSGQVFRWQRQWGTWVGADAETWWRVVPDGNRLKIESNAGEKAFQDYFRLEDSWREVARRIVDAAPETEAAVRTLPGLRLCRPTAAEETFFCFLCTANNHLSRITGMVRALESFGEPMAHGLNRFPYSARISEISEAELRGRGFGYRGATIPKAAQALTAKGADWLVHLRSATYPEAFGELQTLPGIGPKLADCIALYGLHHDAAVPVDTHLWHAACGTFFPGYAGKSLTLRRYREIGNRFRETFDDLAGWAQLLLYAERMFAAKSGWKSSREHRT